MKLEISSKEILEFVDGTGAVPTIKEKLAGAILRCAESPEMETAVRKRVEAVLKEALDNALTVSKGWAGATLHGWASQVFREHVNYAIKGVNFTELIRQMVREELTTRVINIVKEAVDETIRQGVVEAATKRLVDKDLERIINQAVVSHLRALITVAGGSQG